MEFRTKVVSIATVLCILSFVAGICIEKGFGSENHHANLGIVGVISSGEGCPVKQMYADQDLHAYIIYYQKGDFTYDTVDEAFDKIRAVQKHFTDKAIPENRLVLGISSMPEWHDGVMFEAGDGIYIILK